MEPFNPWERAQIEAEINRQIERDRDRARFWRGLKWAALFCALLWSGIAWIV